MHSVQVEITQQVRRLRHHAALAVWCGNNEIEANNVRNDQYRPGYLLLNYATVMTTIQQHDPERALWPSSPSNGFNLSSSALAPFNWDKAQDTQRGDMHNYIYHDACWNR